jgi:hypothetical protein
MQVLPELQHYIDSKKWKYKRASDNDIKVKVCPFCGNTNFKFWIHAEKALYHCWVCSARGNLYRLKRELGDLQKVVSAASLTGDEKPTSNKIVPMKRIMKWHKKLIASESAMDYCERRGFAMNTVLHFKLGLHLKDGKRWLVIPHMVDGICHNVKFRVLPPHDKAFKRFKGGASVLFNQDCLAEFDQVVITEAETDAIALWQAGVKNVVGLTCGADSFLPEWYDLLIDKEKIFLIMDADSVGQNGARSIATRLGFDKCFNILLPAHDANEVLVTLGPKVLKKVLKSAEQFDVHGIVHAADVIMMCQEAEEIGEEGLLTPWRGVNRMLGNGLQPGDLMVLSAKVKTGKTTVALQMATHLSILGVPSLFFCLEMGLKRLGKKLTASVRRRVSDDLQSTDYKLARYIMRRIPLYFVRPDWGESLKIDNVLTKLRESVKRYGIKFLVFDNLHFLCRSLKYVTTEVGQVTRAFKLISEELNLVTVLIAQPKKIEGQRIIKYDDIKDSSSIPADADHVLLLHREAREAGSISRGGIEDESDQDVLDPKMLVRLDAARFSGGGECNLYYEGSTSTLYDWDDRPKIENEYT